MNKTTLDFLPRFILICMLLPVVIWLLVDYLWIDEIIRSDKIIIPEIELVIKNNVIDTVYLYKK